MPDRSRCLPPKENIMSKTKKISNHNVIVTYEETTRIIEDTQGGDEPYSGFRETETYSAVTGVFRKNPETTPYNEDVEIRDCPESLPFPQKIFLVVVKYTTGSTFGTEHGITFFEGAYILEQNAKEIEEMISNGRYEELKVRYPPWIGYFESLESVYVEERVVQ
jgi:hypothetical protein